MIRLIKEPTYLLEGQVLAGQGAGVTQQEISAELQKLGKPNVDISKLDMAQAQKGTIAHDILMAHNRSQSEEKLALKFDELTSHDITYVGIIQTAIASGLDKFPVPYILTNCHNSLSAVGGTINEDDHVFGLSAAKKFGGIFVPPHMAVMHSYMREMYAGGGKMIMGSDSHTRYGALGTMAVGEGGPEIAKQLLSRTYDIAYPKVVGVYFKGKVPHGVGPQDIALTIIGAVFKDGFVKNAVMEFVGPGVESMSVDFRCGVDVMTTETTCWSSIWATDKKVQDWLSRHGRADAYKELKPKAVAGYDRMIVIDLDKTKPMIALPFHPSNAYTIEEFNANTADILRHTEEQAKKNLANPNLTLGLMDKVIDGRLHVDQGVIAGCSGGTFENLMSVVDILNGASTGAGAFSLSVYPGSQAINVELTRQGAIEKLLMSGVVVRTAFCGPCFGAGDTPANHGLSIRHTTRNFPNREGSKPGEGQIASVALMDARSIAATARNKGKLTPASEIDYEDKSYTYHFDPKIYENRVYPGYCKGNAEEKIVFGPNITPWPKMQPLGENLLLKVASVIHDPVTTTDELMPSGETSSLRSNPIRLSQFTLSRKDPEYLGRTKEVKNLEDQRNELISEGKSLESLVKSFDALSGQEQPVENLLKTTQYGTVVVAVKPGDGSAREQAASGQKVLGGLANISIEYATQRYRSNLINWGMLPLIAGADDFKKFQVGDYVYFPGIRKAIETGATEVQGQRIDSQGKRETITFSLGQLNQEERAVILAGCLSNYYAAGK